MKETISVVVPAYNCEAFIEECLSSVLHQSYLNVELIVVDDGSTDNTRKICEELSIADKRIKFISIENNGVSHARNLGLELASGEYIVFLDADDFLSLNILEEAIGAMKKNSLVIWDYSIIGDDRKQAHLRVSNNVLNRHEAVASSLCRRVVPEYELGGYYRAVWGKLFDAEVIRREELHFPEDLPVGEDAYFLVSYLAQMSGDVITIDSLGYNYRILPNSAVRKYRSNLCELDCRQMDYMMALLEENDLFSSEAVSISFNNWKWQMVFSSLLDNSLMGAQKKLLKKTEILNDARKFCKRYHKILKACPVENHKLYKKYQIIQPLYGKIPFRWLCILYIGMSRTKRK